VGIAYAFAAIAFAVASALKLDKGPRPDKTFR
jgi:hypothetical protein